MSVGDGGLSGEFMVRNPKKNWEGYVEDLTGFVREVLLAVTEDGQEKWNSGDIVLVINNESTEIIEVAPPTL